MMREFITMPDESQINEPNFVKYLDIRILCVIFYYFVTFKVSDKISDYGQVENF